MEQRFILRIGLGNAAMQSREDVAEALRDVAEQLEREPGNARPIIDGNGNTVGSWEWSS